MQGRTMMSGALAALVLLSGCGGSDQTAKFKKGYKPVSNQLQAMGVQVGKALQQAGSQTDAQLGATFGGLARRWQTQVSRLQTLKPPSKAAADFNTLTSAASRVESDLNAVVAATATHSAAAAKQAVVGIGNDYLAVRSAAKALAPKVGLK